MTATAKVMIEGGVQQRYPFHVESALQQINASRAAKTVTHGDGREEREKHKYNKRDPRRPQGSKGAGLPSQFRPNNEADQYDEDDNDNGSDEALLIHPRIGGK